MLSKTREHGVDDGSNSLGVNQADDARQTKNALRGRHCDWLIVDHYALDFNWEREFRETVSAIMIIDDLADRRHDCEFLLDQNYFLEAGARYKGLVSVNTQCLLGPKFALIQPQFAEARNAQAPTQSERLFVSMGANDPFRITVKAVAALRKFSAALLSADIVAGTDAAARAEVQSSLNGLKGVTVHGFIGDIASIMARCTLAIGAGGGTTWERCVMGLPSIVIITADNQRKMATDLAQSGVIVLLGDAVDVSEKVLTDTIAALISNPGRRSKMRSDSMDLVDGLGAARVTERLLS
jgi:UDP-2,4-diacetamido-2,4,6-trideoxy-beta-L-altropyranose hydrolase